MSNSIIELFGHPTRDNRARWDKLVQKQICPYTGKVCTKIRKSLPDILIGTCVVNYGRDPNPILICPFRLLERHQIFTDSIHLLALHEPGNELHIVPQISVPGGNVDYFLVSARDGNAIDFVGIELQTLDTTGTVWPFRQRFLDSVGLAVKKKDIKSSKSFGMNWKMTAKTILGNLEKYIFLNQLFSL